jgi:hypothetical protein
MPDGREWPCGEELSGPMALEFIRTVETSQEASDVEKAALGRLFLSFFLAPFDFFTDYITSSSVVMNLSNPLFLTPLINCFSPDHISR